MTRWLLVLVVAGAVSTPRREPGFVALDVVIDAGDRPLAAWQVEISAEHAAVVGVEGGGGPHWKEAPYYDPEALHGSGRIVVGAFTLADAPPSGRVRVARVHLREDGEARYAARLMSAARAGGERFEGKVELKRSEVPK